MSERNVRRLRPVVSQATVASQSSTPQGLRARDYPSILLARKWTILGVTATVVVVGLFLSSQQTPTYVSTASVLVKDPAESVSSASQVQANMATEKDIAQSAAVAQIVIQKLHLGTTPRELLKGLSVEVPVDAQIIDFDYSAHDPAHAQRNAQAFANAYLEYRDHQLLDAQTASEGPIQDRIHDLTAQLLTVQGAPNAGSTQMRAKASSLLAQIAILEQKLADLTPPGGLSGGQVLERAVLPASPASPNHVKDGALAIVAGLILGVAAAILRDHMDDRVRGREDLEGMLGVSALGSIPRIPGLRGSAEKSLVTIMQPDTFAAEAFRRLEANFAFAAARSEAKIVAVTSPAEGEGKTVTTANLGVALARSGKKVVLVSADLRKSRLEKLFGQPGDVGLADILSDEAALADTLLPTAIANLDLLPAGTTPINPTELLETERMSSLLHEIARRADFVLLDTAPLLPVADTLVLAAACDAEIFVVDARTTTRSGIAEARRQLESVNAVLLGAVLIDPNLKAFRSYTYDWARADKQRTGSRTDARSS